jgi:hypothetical protein
MVSVSYFTPRRRESRGTFKTDRSAQYGIADDRFRPTSCHGRDTMATEQLYRERATKAREKAEAASDETTRRTWLEIAKGFERLAEQPEREPVWRVGRVKPKKKPR